MNSTKTINMKTLQIYVIVAIFFISGLSFGQEVKNPGEKVLGKLWSQYSTGVVKQCLDLYSLRLSSEITDRQSALSCGNKKT